MSYVQVANLDFTEIKSSLKEYLRSNSDFTDYDFEGSTLSTILDVLAYNTYYTAFNANMVVNEAFLESATLRDNVVSLAKQIGYLPKSSVSPTAVIDIAADFSTQQNIPEIVKVPRGSQVLTRINGTTYSFITAKDYVVGMWKILQHSKPDDFVLSTGEAFSVRQFVETAFSFVNIKIKWQGKGENEKGIDASSGKTLVKVDKQYYRPLDVNYLCGDSSKAKKALNWNCKFSFKDLVNEMVINDLKRNNIEL